MTNTANPLWDGLRRLEAKNSAPAPKPKVTVEALIERRTSVIKHKGRTYRVVITELETTNGA